MPQHLGRFAVAGAGVALLALGVTGTSGAAPGDGFTCRASASKSTPNVAQTLTPGELTANGLGLQEPALANAAGGPCASAVDLAATGVGGHLTLADLSAQTSGGDRSAVAQARTGSGLLRINDNLIGPGQDVAFVSWGAVESTAGVSCASSALTDFGGSSVSDLRVNEQPVPGPLPTVPLKPTERFDYPIPGTDVVIHMNRRTESNGVVVQQALVFESAANRFSVVIGEAVAGVTGDTCGGGPGPSPPPAPPPPTPPPPPPNPTAVAPTLAAVGPPSGLPGSLVTIAGSKFVQGSIATTVTVRDRTAAIVSRTDTQITAMVPNLTPGPADVRVVVGGQESVPLPFTVDAPPPQPPVVNLVVVPFPDGHLLLDTSLTVDADDGISGRPATGQAAQDLFDGLLDVLTRVDGGAPTRKQTIETELPPGRHTVTVEARSRSGGQATVRKAVFVPRPGAARQVGGRTTVVVPAARVPKANIRLPAQLVFDYGSSRLRPQSEALLLRLGRTVLRTRGVARIIGYTDNIGPEGFNRRLSLARARAVRTFLITKLNIPGRRLTAAGLGPKGPIASNETEAGRQRNRRVDIQLPITTKRQVLRDAEAEKRVARTQLLERRAADQAGGTPQPPPPRLGIY